MDADKLFGDILIEHTHRYPLWEIKDLYKLAHQAAMGSEHALTDEASARDWLAQEIAQLGPGPAEPMLDPISPDGEIMRVHLRPFLDQGYSSSGLLKAFVLTAGEVHGSVDALKSFWNEAKILAEDGKIPFTIQAVHGFFDEKSQHDFPAVHHSAAFESAYRPAYRVIAKAFLPDIFVKFAD